MKDPARIPASDPFQLTLNCVKLTKRRAYPSSLGMTRPGILLLVVATAFVVLVVVVVVVVVVAVVVVVLKRFIFLIQATIGSSKNNPFEGVTQREELEVPKDQAAIYKYRPTTMIRVVLATMLLSVAVQAATIIEFLKFFSEAKTGRSGSRLGRNPEVDMNMVRSLR
ncbi:hypothetical protein ElyMa_001540300 [Elysia marginata]|uniref:Uncharacterized protein n=1 Tax=Elysia marginata TaxID=1093978 RepID=A0AAV4J8V7_9GAST|nr:hypothetical protein ElyMa_001540300 [Elysia marginata]